ncbi:MAG TPA: FemAB family XrtA/PEP-CTERM system-associated protein [Gemmatimonadaceae bacterium]|nr:FemAB family XrtA/PEP-CTERM system-associated protein [Gemmatimonadaceae bacterium]
MRVAPFDGSAREWDGFVQSQRGWSHFHLAGWRQVVENVFGHECLYAAARDAQSGALRAVLPLVRVRSVLFGHYLVSMPFVNYGGPLGDDDGVRALAAWAVQVADASDVKLLELRSRCALPVPLAASHRKITVTLPLPTESEALWRSLPAKVRSQIRRPQKEGVTVRFGADQVAPFHDVFSVHMRDLGTPAQPRRLFEAIVETFPDDVHVGCAYLHGRPIACGFGIRWGDELEMTWASALRAHKQVAANMLVYWSLMERAIEAGVRTFNFGRCTPGGGTHRFKQQWGGSDEPLWWYTHARGGVATTPSPDAGPYALGARLWRRLPVAAARALGPSIVRCIP